MKKILTFLLLFTFILVGCGDNEDSNAEIPTVSNTSPEEGSASNNDPEVDDIEVEVYNGFAPRDELEDKYFSIIGKMWDWNSFVLDYSYNTFLSDENDIPEEVNITSRYVIEPFQLHQVFHSIYFRDDYIERYATEKEAFVNFQMEEWEKEEDFSSLVNPLESRMDLYYSFVANSYGLVELGDGRVAVDILPEQYEYIYEMIQLAFHHDIRLNSDEYATAVKELTEPLEELEGIAVEFTFENDTLTNVYIIISYNRTDELTVDQIHISESYNEINAFDSIDIPDEVYGS